MIGIALDCNIHDSVCGPFVKSFLDLFWGGPSLRTRLRDAISNICAENRVRFDPARAGSISVF
jgi:hypothetical protein